MEREDGEREVR